MNEENNPEIIRMPSSEIIEGYRQLKEALIKAGQEEEAKDVTMYKMANSLDEAEVAYPSIIDENLAFVLLKRCSIDDGTLVVFGIRKQKMITLCEELKKINAGEDVDIEQILRDFE